MNKILFFNLLLFCVSVFSAMAQTDTITVPPVINPSPSDLYMGAVTKEAEFPGGASSMNTFINNNLVLPNEVRKKRISGRIFVTFIVSKDGYISDIQIVKNLSGCTECNERVIALIKKMPKWNPALNNGYPVNRRILIRIN